MDETSVKLCSLEIRHAAVSNVTLDPKCFCVLIFRTAWSKYVIIFQKLLPLASLLLVLVGHFQ